jgi:hypothetical protein
LIESSIYRYLITGIYIVFIVLVIISLGLSRPIISKKHEEMKLLAKEDKKYKKIPNKEQKGVNCARHRTMMRPHRGTMDMFRK